MILFLVLLILKYRTTFRINNFVETLKYKNISKKTFSFELRRRYKLYQKKLHVFPKK